MAAKKPTKKPAPEAPGRRSRPVDPDDNIIISDEEEVALIRAKLHGTAEDLLAVRDVIIERHHEEGSGGWYGGPRTERFFR